MAKFTPMLAQAAEFEQVKLPALMSPKIDGFRCAVWGGQALTRSLKPMPNLFIRQYLSQMKYEGLDGELVVGTPDDPLIFSQTTGQVRSSSGQPDFTWWVFDHRAAVEDARPFTDRLAMATTMIADFNDPRIRILPHIMVTTREEQAEFEAWCLEHGYEGSMARDPAGPYKNGRSTWREGWLVKRKTFVDGEAIITGFYELLHNANEAYTDETGKTKRSTHAENMVPMGVLGGFTCKEMGTDIEFNLGGGFTMDERAMIWRELQADPHAYDGEIVRFKHFPYGRDVKPRMPTFGGFRAPEDIGDEAF